MHVLTALALTCTTLALAGCLWGWYLSAQQVTRAREAADEAAEALRARLERPSVFSHEVRTPLALIKGAAELLAEETPGPLNPRQREFVTTITSNAEQVIGMAEDLLTEARMSSRLFRLDRELLDIRSLASDTVRTLRRIHDVPIRLSGQGRPLYIEADRGLLRQALYNVVNNAARHAGPDVTITVEVTEADGQIVVAVSDDGSGMSAKDRETLFTPFAVGSSHRPGTGLGMMITESIVTEHGGRVLVDTVDGHGTTFFLTLPSQAPAVR
ncbi:Adaptive-response sensory-kinase SasA [Austwickia sp. TVS 96-490-7B]|uniref:sensor histidine kinase n=1 Tax=Austwickia sp. TVS 96-490-7B TaxID=2830843 RepID=UPI001C591DFB|nr:HAMP domain-containing sensor histidine kinase [Austwickia sp. TVS 96-490-7B]MBW3084282.1 Adaptive-response sensory-kinase SasA [Austwickia sp. TVS 96-490-7B]